MSPHSRAHVEPGERTGRVPVRDAGGAFDGLRSEPAEDDVQTALLVRFRRYGDPVELPRRVEQFVPLVDEFVVLPRLLQDLNEVCQTERPVVERDVHRLELLHPIAVHDPERQPPLGDVIDDGEVLGETNRLLVQGTERDVRTEFDLVRCRRQRCQHTGGGRRVSSLGEVVLGHPRTIEVVRLCYPCEIDHLPVQFRVWTVIVWMPITGERPEPYLHD